MSLGLPCPARRQVHQLRELNAGALQAAERRVMSLTGRNDEARNAAGGVIVIPERKRAAVRLGGPGARVSARWRPAWS